MSHGVSTRWHTVYAVAYMQGHFPLTRLLTLSRPGCVRVLDLVPISFLKTPRIRERRSSKNEFSDSWMIFLYTL